MKFLSSLCSLSALLGFLKINERSELSLFMNEASHLISPTELTEAETVISFTRPRSDSSSSSISSSSFSSTSSRSSTASSSSKSSSSSLGDVPRITFTGLENLDSLIDFFDVNDSQDIDVGLKFESKAADKLKSLLKKGKSRNLEAEKFISNLKLKFEKITNRDLQYCLVSFHISERVRNLFTRKGIIVVRGYRWSNKRDNDKSFSHLYVNLDQENIVSQFRQSFLKDDGPSNADFFSARSRSPSIAAEQSVPVKGEASKYLECDFSDEGDYDLLSDFEDDVVYEIVDPENDVHYVDDDENWIESSISNAIKA